MASEDSGAQHIASTPHLQKQAVAGPQQDEGPASAQSTPSTAPLDNGFRPLTRAERRNNWLMEYNEQDIAIQMWVRLVEQQDLQIEIMLQMHGLLIFGSMVATIRYAQFYIELNEEMHREHDPDTADALGEYYTALVPPPDQPEIGPEGLPIMFRYVHMSGVTILSGSHKMKVSFWRGKISEIDAFVIGATPPE